MNFIIFLCVTIKLFSLSFVPLLLTPNAGDVTVTEVPFSDPYSGYTTVCDVKLQRGWLERRRRCYRAG